MTVLQTRYPLLELQNRRQLQNIKQGDCSGQKNILNCYLLENRNMTEVLFCLLLGVENIILFF